MRFTAASDRLAWLRQPANGFGWIGDGVVRFVPEGVLILGRHLTLLGRRGSPKLIRPDEIRDVYREGNAVQINLRDAGRGQQFLRFWAEDVADAAELVARLPTTRTIELETLLRAPQSAGQALRPSIWFLALAALALAGLAALKGLQSPAPEAAVPPPAATPLPHLAGPAADELQQAVDSASAAEVLQARADLERFDARFDALTQQFAVAFNALTVGGTLSQEEFADGLDKWLLPQWAALAAQLPQEAATPQEPAILRARADRELGGVIAGWQRALRLYADGLRAQNSGAVNAAFDAMREAEGHEGRARQLLRRLESRQDESARAANR